MCWGGIPFQGEATFFGFLSRVTLRIFEYGARNFLSISILESGFGTFEGALRSVTVDLLKKRTTGAEDEIVSGKVCILDGLDHVRQRSNGHSVTLDQTDSVFHQSVHFAILTFLFFTLKFGLFTDDSQKFWERLRRFAGVGANDQNTVAAEDLIFELSAP